MSSIDDKPPVAPPFSIQNIVSKLKKLTQDCKAKVDPPPKQTTDGTNTTTEADNDGRKKAVRELEKLCKELDYMLMSFQKLDEFEKNLREPLKTLENNVKDILDDLEKPDLPQQIHNNLRVLRNNITRVKITIPVQHQTASLNSEGNHRGLQTTVATGDEGNLPHLYSELKGKDIFAESYYFKEIKEKYESLDTREKLCLLCCSIFPENAVIKKRLLAFWWVGENLIQPPHQAVGKDEKGIIKDTLDTFVEKGFIQPVLKKNKLRSRSYKMNPVVRSCLIKFAKEAMFFAYDSDGKPSMDFSSYNKACMVKSEGATASWFSDYLKQVENDRGQKRKLETLSVDLERLQMFFNFPDQNTLKKASERFDKLQTLFNLSKQFPALPTEWLLKMTGLKVLYLGKWETSGARIRYIEMEEDLLKGLKNMKNLRLLSLQGISGIRKIPGDLCKLENLRILDLRACYSLEKLPNGIGSLKKLTYLDLSECYLFDYMPKQLNQLAQLQVLKGFVIVDVKNSCTLSDLSKLKNLRKLSINVKTTKFDIDEQQEALSRLPGLKKLKIAWRPGGFIPDIDKEDSSTYYNRRSSSSESESKKQQQRNSYLRRAGNMVLAVNRLMSRGKVEKPRRLRGLENLVKLDLQCFPRPEPPTWLHPKKLVSLTNLTIRGGRLAKLAHKDGWEWKVDNLRLKFLMDFNINWKELQERFPRLRYLDIVRSPGITFCPCDVNGVWRNSSE